ncbi:endonuclease YncB(thermonuclease family) [Rhizobium sp. BK068]|nr:thermonuclease family protein [Rhizobium sp. BK068]TCM76623.1 endonuclease YncB(thermonuclease family) [Rhizobium sp. BK068]
MTKTNVIPFRKPRKADGRNERNRWQGKSPRSGPSRPRAPLIGILCATIIAMGGWLVFGGAGSLSGLLAAANTPTSDSLSAAFLICGADRHVNCVVDGDTFWFQGEKIRVADIDTPELSPPRCEAERIRGEAAKARLLALLNSGKFSLSAGSRDEDKYGRKLRTVTRSGRSLGDNLIAEGLARRWDGARHPWCD